MTRILKTRNRLAKIYGIGILAFVAFFGTLTVLVRFIAQLDMG